MKIGSPIVILASLILSFYMVPASFAQGEPSLSEINEELLEQKITPELWKETLRKFDEAADRAEAEEIIQDLKDTFWEISGEHQANYYIVTHMFLREYRQLPTAFKIEHEDQFTFIYRALLEEPTYSP